MMAAGFDQLVAVGTIALGAGCGVLGSTVNPFLVSTSIAALNSVGSTLLSKDEPVENTAFLTGSSLGNWWFSELSIWFVVMAIIIGAVYGLKEKEIVGTFVEGASEIIWDFHS